MPATVKTLLENHGELYWGSRQAYPGYHFGLSLDVTEEGVAARVVYVMSDFDDDDEELVTPDELMACYTMDDLERNGIVLSNLMDANDESSPVKGWYCAEESLFYKDQVEALQKSNTHLGGYLDIILQIMLISPQEVADGLPTLDELSFFELLSELEGISERIDEGALKKPLPFSFRLVGDALFGWQFADENDYR